MDRHLCHRLVQEARSLLRKTMGSVVSFYKFVSLTGLEESKLRLLKNAEDLGIVGSILLAREGINGTIAHGEKSVLEKFVSKLQQDSRFSDLELKWSRSSSDTRVFHRLKVAVRREIVNFGSQLENVNDTGRHVDPHSWNQIVDDENVLLIDTRNTYESEIGSFSRALKPDIKTFRDFTNYVKNNIDPSENPKVALFCTGGIRCEKASAWMLNAGFEDVAQLEGGIINYLDNVSESDSRWTGECFVFDQRVTVTANLEQGSYKQCHACRRPISIDDMQSPQYRKGISCPKCFEEKTQEQRNRYEERARQEALAEARGTKHIGKKQSPS